MKKKIAILGSTGSIGKNLLDIINDDKKNFEVVLLTAKKNYKALLKQATNFKVKNIIIIDQESYKKAKQINKNNKINIYNDFTDFNKIFTSKIDYTMSSIIGLDGLYPTLGIIKYTKTIAIANKEAIICGWNLIKKKLNLYKTKFLPVDSEHFSIWKILKSQKIENIDQIFITASGGPFLNKSINQIKNVKVSAALKHPNWKMGKKISIDSATMMNKVFEVVETKNIFSVSYKKISILIHPKSYIHAIVKFNDGTSQFLTHEPSMKIPIFNTLYLNHSKKIKSKNLDIDILNNLKLKKIDKNIFPVIKILESLPSKSSLFETVVVSANDQLVNLFINKKINFHEISKNILKIINMIEFQKYKKIKPKYIKDIHILSEYVRLKVNSLCV
jgi:1-deoxy-D-xylulose-5-phosphate reductoisomerase